MRWGMLSIAALCASWSATAQAQQTITTSTTTDVCDVVECFEFDTFDSALQPFDSSLGTLTGVTLEIDATSLTDYSLESPDGVGPNASGSAQLSFESPFDAVVNGVTYSFEIAGTQDVSTTGEVFVDETFYATGSKTFALDPALFSTFIGTYDLCHSGVALPSLYGVCVTGQPETSPTIDNINIRLDNLMLEQIGADPFTQNLATYVLTYTYRPFSVPEPATWMMMLLGFGVLGFSMRCTRGSMLAHQDLDLTR